MRKITTGKFIITGITIMAAIAMTGCSKKTENAPDADMTVISLSEIESRGEASGEDAVSTEAEETDEVNSVHSITETSASVKEITTDPANTEAQNTTEAETTAEETTIAEETTTEAPAETTTEVPVTAEAPTTQPETTTQVENTTEAPVTTEAPATQPESTTEAQTEHVHNYVGTVTMETSCTHYGITTYTCSCGDSYEEKIPVIWHTFDNFVYNNDATDRTPGTETGHCIYCGAECKRNAMYSMPEKNEYEADLTGVTDITAFMESHFEVYEELDGHHEYKGEYIGHIEGYAYADIPWDTGYYIPSQGHWNGPELDKLIGNVEEGMEMYYIEPYYCNNEFMYVNHWGWSAYDENLGWYDEGQVNHRFTYPNGADPIAYYNDNFNQ